MNTKLSNNIKSLIQFDDFDKEYEAKMVQSRILSTVLEVIENQNLTQLDLENLTGLKQPFLSSLFNLHKKLNMEHIALFQKALKIKLQPPSYFTEDSHIKQFYLEDDYEAVKTHFIDSEDLKNNPFLSWINPKEIDYSHKNQSYSLSESITISNYSPKESCLKILDEVYK